MRIPDHTIEEITERSRIEDIVGEYTSLEKKGGRYWGLCPFHHEKTPSFSVNPEKGLFYCFGCQKGGTVFTFIMETEHLTFVEAAQFLAKKAGIEISTDNDTPRDSKKQAILELYTRVAGSYHYILNNSEEAGLARNYLADRLISEESIEKFEIGWAPRDRYWLYGFLRKKDYSTEFLKGTSLFSKKNERASLFRGRLMFPIQKAQGQVIGFGGRLLNEDGPKYINSPESEFFKKRENLYGFAQAMPRIRKTKQFVLAEGYMDVITMHQAEITNCVAPLGTSFTDEQARLLKRYANQGVVLFDGDEAGIRAAKKAVFVLEGHQIDTSVALPPPDTDPADIYRKEGAEALKNLVKCSINSSTFLLQNAVRNKNIESLADRQKVLEEIYSYIDIIQSEVKKDICIKEFADHLKIEPQSIWKDYLNFTTQKRTPKRVQRGPEEQNRPKLGPELYLMIAIIENHDYFTTVRNEIEPDDLDDKESRQLFYILEDAYRKGEISRNFVLENLENNSLKNIILEMLSSNAFQINKEQIIKDSIKKIKQHKLEKKKAAIIQKIRRQEKQHGFDKETTELLAEQIFLDQELEKLRVHGDVRRTD